MSPQLKYATYYEYDVAGNRTAMVHVEGAGTVVTYYTYNAGNELTDRQVGLIPWEAEYTHYNYDANGNMIRAIGPTRSQYYRWDGRDLLERYYGNEGDEPSGFYRYDGMGSRVATVEPGAFSYYDWDGIRVLQEKTGSGTVTERQVHGYAPIPSVGDIALMDKGGTPYVPISDQVGTVWGLANSAGARVNYYEYDAFGVGRGETEDVWNPYRFGTKRLDAESELYHFIARQYMPDIGRFASSDLMMQYPGNPSYVYVQSSVLVFVDPTGLWHGPDHNAITSRAINKWDHYLYINDVQTDIWHVRDRDCYSYVHDVLPERAAVEPSISTHPERHYNRPRDSSQSNVPLYNQKYLDYIPERMDTFLSQFASGSPDDASRRGKCREAMKALGNFTHAWEDYFAHAVLKTLELAAPAWTAGISGTPDNLDDRLMPASWSMVGLPFWCGDHPCGSEPSDAYPEERQKRYDAAEVYVAENLKVFVADWVQNCPCLCDKAWGVK